MEATILDQLNESWIGLTDAEADASQQLYTNMFWPNGSTYFINGNNRQQSFIKEYARHWQRHMNLAFNFNSKEEGSHIRILITPRDGGAWSTVGVPACKVMPPEHTMELNLQAELLTPDDQHTVLHEFG